MMGGGGGGVLWASHSMDYNYLTVNLIIIIIITKPFTIMYLGRQSNRSTQQSE